MRCPFPDCPQQTHVEQEARVDELADGIFLCSDCGRLSYLCVVCEEALNRPFGHFCRRCGQCQYLRSRSMTANDRWRMVQQFDYDWEFVATDGHYSQARDTTDVLVLNERLHGFRADASVLIECGFGDGLFAIHQGGGAIALVHPFRDLADEDIVAWQVTEEDLLLDNNCERPQVRYHGNWYRPFKPLFTPDRRYGIFSTPYAVFAVDVGSLPHWQSIVRERAAVVASWNEQMGIQLAAQPIPLTNQGYPLHQNKQTELRVESNRLGLVVRIGGRLHWHVVDLDESFCENRIIRDQGVEWKELPITGDRIQVLDYNRSALILATQTGHWFWRLDDAAAGDTDQIVPLGTESAVGSIELAREVVQDRMFFSWQRQHLYSRGDELAIEQDPNFYLSYSRNDGATTAVEMHKVAFDSPNLSQRAAPVSYNKTAVQYPIGPWTSTEQLRELLFIADYSGTIYRPIDGSGMGTLYAGTFQAGTLKDIHGLQFNDPLLVLVKSDVQDEKAHTIEMRSAWHHETIAIAEGVYLKSDPIAWSNFLFTCETTKNDGRVFLRRREFRIRSHGTNSHLSERPAVGS